MESSNINKIIIVSLCDKWAVEVGDRLSQTLGVMFCNVEDLVEYELLDKEKLAAVTSQEYLKESEAKVMRHVASFENVVASISYDYYVNNLKVLKKNAITFFLEVPKKFVREQGATINVLAYEERNKKLESECDFSLKMIKTEPDFVCEKIINTLRSNL